MGAALSAAGPDFRAACRLAEKARTELEGLLEGREAQLLSSYLDHRDQAELEVDLRRFFGRAHKVVWEDRRLTCSAGVLRFQVKRPAEELYVEADKLLYQAKEKGRDQYVIGLL